MASTQLSERQRKWFASVRAGLERDTGKTLGQWTAIARTCPETGQRARLKWLKDNHGLLQNRGALVLVEAFGAPAGWSDPQALIDGLWTDPCSRAIFEAVDESARALEGAIQTARKGYTAWAREFQFAALKPVKGGGALLGLALPASADPDLESPRNESWSERLKSSLLLAPSAGLHPRLAALLRSAWQAS
ncbi:MAG TPA: DUF4287 domain-containing protein [Caulobacteraceae bacterium]